VSVAAVVLSAADVMLVTDAVAATATVAAVVDVVVFKLLKVLYSTVSSFT
jgi:hypothetical protein